MGDKKGQSTYNKMYGDQEDDSIDSSFGVGYVNKTELNNNSAKTPSEMKCDYEQNMFHQICDKIEELSEQFTEILPVWGKAITKLQDLTGHKKRHILLVLFASPIMICSLVLFAHILVPLVMLFYPVIMSVKAIEQKQEARTRWLIFWLFYNTSGIAEHFVGSLLNAIPGYTIGRALFFIWCMAPINENGCYFAYHLMRPILMLPVHKIDQCILESVNKFETVVRKNEKYAVSVTLNAAGMAGNLLQQVSGKSQKKTN